jgi:hypothetical protein
MRTLMAVSAVVVVVSGCASQDALVKRREEIRGYNAQSPVDLAKVRSNEGVRGATWGMTVDEVIALKGEPNERAPNALMYLEQIDGQAVPSSWLFLDGHLAQVKSRFDADLQPSARLVAALKLKWGEPLRDFDKATSHQEAVDSARRWDLISAGIGASLLTTAAIAGGGRVHGAGHYPGWFGPERGDRALIEHSLQSQAMPARDVVWATHDSEVHLVTLDSGLSEVTWGSKPLGRRLVSQQMSAAGLTDLAASM